MPQSYIAKAIQIGSDARIIRIRITKSLPKSRNALYELTTLDDLGFEELAKPTTKYQEILDYKRRLKAPEVDWTAADAAMHNYRDCQNDWCLAIKKLYLTGSVTKETIATHFDCALEDVELALNKTAMAHES